MSTRVGVGELVFEVESADEASARSGQLEAFNGEGEVVVGRIEDESTLVDVLLDAFRLVAGGHQRTGGSDGVDVALLDADVLVKFVAVRLDLVDNDPPLALNVDSPQWLDVGRATGAQVGLFHQLLQTIDRVVRVGHHVLVQTQHGVVVLIEGVDHIIGRVVSILHTPGFGRVLGTFRNLRLVLAMAVRCPGQCCHHADTQ